MVTAWVLTEGLSGLILLFPGGSSVQHCHTAVTAIYLSHLLLNLSREVVNSLWTVNGVWKNSISLWGTFLPLTL
jgi:hypothetical protein